MIEALSSRIWKRAEFQAEYHALLRANLRQHLGIPGSKLGEVESLDHTSLGRLLQCASYFAATGNLAFREAAYRIVAASWQLAKDDDATIAGMRGIAQVILGRLGNFAASSYLAGTYAQGAGQDSSIPLALWLEIEGHARANSIRVGRENDVVLTDFQAALWSVLESRSSAAVTAPTSAGKSFALGHFLVKVLGGGVGRWGLYIVPTRALISQVSSDLLRAAASAGGSGLSVSTIPVPPDELGMTGGIYVVTQERLQILHDASPSLSFDLVVVDEAQMLADSARGVILQTVIEEVLRRSPSAQLLFGSPQTKNPEIFGQIFDHHLEILPAPERPVAQNLIHVRTDPVQRNRVAVALDIERTVVELGSSYTDIKLAEDDQILASLAVHFGFEGRNLIYAGGKAKCEDIAALVRQMVEGKQAAVTDGCMATRRELSEFIREHVHPQYSLATNVLDGVAFHYGNMPSLVRKVVEEHFAEGIVDFLVCTSTLLYGVNLPAKNMFLLKPTKGREWSSAEDTPVSSVDFWNLVGRAGRLGKELEGNVFLIDLDRWASRPIDGARDQVVCPSLNQIVRDQGTELIEFARNGDHASGRQPKVETAFVKLVNACRSGRLDQALGKIFGSEDLDLAGRIRESVEGVAAGITVPERIAEKHITVSLLRQQEMFDYLLSRLAGIRDPEGVVPIHPARPWDEARKSLLRLFKRIHTHFERKPGKDKSHTYFAPLALRWMRGEPLPRLIDAAIEYRREKAPRSSTATIIRSVLEDIETDLRFRYVKYVSCYRDLLEEALRRTGREELIGSVPPIHLFLELGAYSGTMVSLLSLGVSRTTAGLISAKAVSQDLGRTEVEQWLLREKWEESGLSPICIRELTAIVQGIRL